MSEIDNEAPQLLPLWKPLMVICDEVGAARWGIGIKDGYMVPLELVPTPNFLHGMWQPTFMVPTKLAEHFEVFAAQNFALLRPIGYMLGPNAVSPQGTATTDGAGVGGTEPTSS